MKKKILLFVLTLLPLVASAEAVEIDGIWYNLVSKIKEAEVTNTPTGKYTGSVVIPEKVSYEGSEYSVTSIGNGAFSGSGLTSVSIPNSVTSIGGNAFGNCIGLASVHISDLAAWCRIKFENNSNPLMYAHHLFLNGEEIKDLVIPNSVTSIGGAFSGCSGLTSVTIPNSVTSIGSCAFYKCSGLTSVNIPNSVTSIFNEAFEECSGLTSVTIPNSVTSIDFAVFKDCIGLKSVTIPNSVTNIGPAAFVGCVGLMSVTIPNSVTNIGDNAFGGCIGLMSVTIPNSMTSIDNGTFQGCSGLTSVTIPNSVISIGSSAFQGCSGLTSVAIPNSVTSIGSYAFQGCSGLTTISIGKGVQSISYHAFANCPELTDVYCYAENIPYNTQYDTFEGSYIEYATLHVPAALVNVYQQKEPWSSFKNIVVLDGDMPEVQKCATPTIGYSNGKLTFHSETEGVEYKYEITDADIRQGLGSEVQLAVTYNVSVFAIKQGYDNSDVATATLCWVDKEPAITTDVAQIPAQAVLITSEGGMLNVEGADDGTQVSVYSVNGKMAGEAVSRNGSARIVTNLQPGTVAIVKIGQKSVKVVVR